MWAVVGGVGVVLAAWEAWRGQVVTALVVLLALGVAAWWMSPWRAPGGSTQAEVLARPADARGVVVYWRPGCPFCERLRRGLGAEGRRTVTWVDIWKDDEAAAFVRSVNEGNETVPTVLVDGVPHTNPDPAFVREALSR